MPRIVLTNPFFADASKFRISPDCFQEIAQYVGERYQEGTFFYEHDGYVMRTLLWKKYKLHYQVHQRTDTVEVTGLSENKPGDGPNKKNFLLRVLERLVAAELHDDIKDLLDNAKNIDFDFLIRHYNWKFLRFLSPTAVAIIEEVTADWSGNGNACDHVGTDASRHVTPWEDDGLAASSLANRWSESVVRFLSLTATTAMEEIGETLTAGSDATGSSPHNDSSDWYLRQIDTLGGAHRIQSLVGPLGAREGRSVTLVGYTGAGKTVSCLSWYLSAFSYQASSRVGIPASNYEHRRPVFGYRNRSLQLINGLAETAYGPRLETYKIMSRLLSGLLHSDGFYVGLEVGMQELNTESKEVLSIRMRKVFDLCHTICSAIQAMSPDIIVNAGPQYYPGQYRMQVQTCAGDIAPPLSQIQRISKHVRRVRYPRIVVRRPYQSAFFSGRGMCSNVHSANIARRTPNLSKAMIGYGERHGDEFSGAR